mmetsp:Transcript_50098/g.125631  ORF Transcript_50098/g.125631 Transcript_50098/m.125631 type:complete len:83 (+) Transcript_50098:119-367(+)
MLYPCMVRVYTASNCAGRHENRETTTLPRERVFFCPRDGDEPVILHTGFVLLCWNGQILICVSPSLSLSLSPCLPACLPFHP